MCPVPGTFCNAAIKAAERDHDMLVLSLVQSRQELREQVANLFHKIDYRGSGQITITDFESHFSEPDVIAFFESLEIGAMDAWTLFLSLDARFSFVTFALSLMSINFL